MKNLSRNALTLPLVVAMAVLFTSSTGLRSRILEGADPLALLKTGISRDREWH